MISCLRAFNLCPARGTDSIRPPYAHILLALLRPPPFPSFFPVQASPRTAGRVPCLRYLKLEKKRRERAGQLRRACREIPDSILPAPPILPEFEGSVPLTRSTEKRGIAARADPGKLDFHVSRMFMHEHPGRISYSNARNFPIYTFPTPLRFVRRSGRIRFLSPNYGGCRLNTNGGR